MVLSLSQGEETRREIHPTSFWRSWFVVLYYLRSFFFVPQGADQLILSDASPFERIGMACAHDEEDDVLGNTSISASFVW